MADLISRDFAKQALQQDTAFSAAEDAIIDDLISGCSKAIKKFCAREFDSQTFDELYSGDGGNCLLLKQYPILSVARVATSLTPVLRIRNTSSANQRATASITATGLSLTRVASGVASTDTSVTFAGNVTVQAVANAVDALGNGWDAEALSPYTLWPSADLKSPQGSLNVAGSRWAEFKLHVEELSDYAVDADRGWLTRGSDGQELSAAFPDASVPYFSGWSPGVDNYRVVYTGGYSTVPEDIQTACAEWLARLYFLWKKDRAVTNEVPASGTSYAYHLMTGQGMPRAVREILAPHRRRRI